MKSKKGKTNSSVKKKEDETSKDVPITQPSGVEGEDAQSIEKVRDILFGAQTRQNEQKFARMEALLQKEIVNLRDETKITFNSLENYINKELATLTDQIKTERDERTESAEVLSILLKDSNKNIEKKITKLDEKNVKSQRDLQGQILQQSKELMTEIRAKHEEISASLEQSVNHLVEDKTDRLALANLFMEMSMRLKDEFDIPDIK
ncbi:MAG: hypothetical protein JRJ41_02045 [Deltaproteobacteria bacterium]|jgi:hypothetical protein|nr:hypothetical protein [Deltaproteobacteria bacterium]